jgi:competence protein ComEC
LVRVPPVTRLALAFAAGAAWGLIGAPFVLAPPVALLLLQVPIGASRRPGRWRAAWVAAGLAGLVSSVAFTRASLACAPARADAQASPEGRFLARPRDGVAPFAPTGGCEPFSVVTADAAVPAGRAVRVEGVWREGRGRPWLLASSVEAMEGRRRGEWRWWPVRWRGALVDRLERLYGERTPLVAALTLARREGLDPELRDAFARVGIAHLLAISGFHVGVVAGVLVALLMVLGLDDRRASLGAAVGAWLYVGLIGFPDAACRAALILAAAALTRARGRPPARWGALGSALLVLLALDPRRIASPGFQLSFAGAAGLAAWAGPMSRALQRACRGRMPRTVALAVAAGVAATLATLPVVAWHFERVSLVGIPVTLLATPLVSLGLVGALVSLALDFVSHALASTLAGGVGVLMGALEALARAAASLPWASVWTTRGSVVAGLAGVAAAMWLARRPRIGARARRSLTVVYVCAGVVAWPLLLSMQGRGTVEVLMIDVGQGDAIALRSPRGRWVLVDTGPASADADPMAHAVVRALESHGVRRLEALVLTHPDLDHIGGATAVLASFEVGVVLDPGLPAGKEAFVGALELAATRRVPWRAARAGDHIDIDGLWLDVLYPDTDLPPDAETNASSIVLHASWGRFDALLSGDAYKDVDRLLAPMLTEPVEVLKVGHHGSDTSTDPLLLEHARPALALISVGRSNRYGHPAPEVLDRLLRSGAEIHRTDREGTVSVLGRPDGRWFVRSRR